MTTNTSLSKQQSCSRVAKANLTCYLARLFDRRGGMYSSRPDNHIANDLIFKDKTHILFLPYGREWRLMRKTLQELLRTTVVDEILADESDSDTPLASRGRWWSPTRSHSGRQVRRLCFAERYNSVCKHMVNPPYLQIRDPRRVYARAVLKQ
jgi:hypothetical protein